jgi:hypothetical protein
MKTIDELAKTTFSGRRFTRKQLALVQEVVEMFGNLSRKELARTICEQLTWISPNDRYKINSCLKLLEALEVEGVISLPAKRVTKKSARRIPAFEEHPAAPPIKGTLASIAPIKLQRVRSKDDRENWKAYLQTHHYLGYKHPFGSHLGYFVVSGERQQKLGCLLFSASAAWALAPRDKWIGWDEKHRAKLLHLVLSNDRFLIFPWVDVPNLASHVLSLATKQISDDWLEVYGYRPVLIETFVDSAHYTGTCYRAANWHYLGKTQGRGRFDPQHESQQTKKEIFVYPLQSDWRECLTTVHSATSLKKRYRNERRASQTGSVDDAFVALWKNVVHILRQVAQEFDEQWRVRKRVIDSTMLMLLIFRLVSSKNAQSYGTTIDDLWESCRRLKIALPQKRSIAASSFCVARTKLDESVFKCLNGKILAAYAPADSKCRWWGHRLFAIDGSKINLPRELIACGYSRPSDKVHYPEGLLSSLYQVQTQLPFDFDLVSHGDERECAVQHLKILQRDDVVVYDRGYYSYLMLHQHHKTGIHAIFRLQKSSSTAIREFFSGPENDRLATIYPSLRAQLSIRKKVPDIDFIPLKMRLVKYEVAGSMFCLGTTLVEPHQHYPLQDFSDVYHSRWGVEELYKVSKRVFEIQDFHARTERGVKQELFAHFVLITMNRLFAAQTETKVNADGNAFLSTQPSHSSEPASANQTIEKARTNFKNCIHVITRSLEELLILHEEMDSAVNRAFNSIVGQHQRVRPGRSYPRKSMKPVSKWRPTLKRTKKKTTSVPPVPVSARPSSP